MPTRHLDYASELDAPVGEVWARVGTMAGVNDELGPWLHMTTPPDGRARDLHLENAPIGELLFTSVVLFLRALPIDVHHLRLARVLPGRGFVEESTTWSERRWKHQRLLEPRGPRCVLRDRLTFTPRLAMLTPFLALAVDRTFRHRHARLRAHFGGGPRAGAGD